MNGERKYLKRFIILLLLGCSLTGCSTLLFRKTDRYIRYPVQSGDSLYAISNRFSVSVSEIQTKNDIGDPRKLTIGQVLKIPYHGQDISRHEGEQQSTRASFGGLSVKGSSSDAAGLSRVELGLADRYVGKLKMPVTGGSSHISSQFGRRWTTFHEGIDISGPMGHPIVAAHDGQVVYSGNGIRGYGNIVVVKAEHLITVYGHNRRNLVRVGEHVRRGERIAELGASGKATGPHCHFETRIPNASGRFMAVNPLAFFR